MIKFIIGDGLLFFIIVGSISLIAWSFKKEDKNNKKTNSEKGGENK
jgi:hypothetical protein